MNSDLEFPCPADCLGRALFNATPDAVTIADMDGRLVFVSRQTLLLHGYEQEEELVGKSAFTLIVSKDHAAAQQNMEETLRKGILHHARYTMLRRDGSSFPGELSAALMRNSQDDPIGFIAVTRDITPFHQEIRERKQRFGRIARLLRVSRENTFSLRQQTRQQRMQLRSNQELLEIFFNSTHYLIAYLDREFNFVRVNQAYAASDNKSPDYFPGKNHFALFPNEENRKIFRQVVDSGETVTVFAKPFQFPDHPEWGTSYWDWSLQPIKDAQDIVTGLILVLVDVTKRIRAEQELERTRSKLDQSKRLSEIGTLATTVAHELGTPLSVISTATYNMRRKLSQPDLEKHLENITLKVRECEQIISNLKGYARIRPPRLAPVPIQQLVTECVTTIKKTHTEKKCHFELDLAPLTGLTLQADSVQLKQVCNNLLENALYAVPQAGGHISVVAELQEGMLLLRISDNGPGMDQQVLEHAFEPFFSHRANGTGLGLPVVRQIMELHHGWIDIQSEPGNGTVCTVSLPLEAH